MLIAINPKLPMREKTATLNYYSGQLDFRVLADYGDYLLLEKDQVQLHFFLFAELNPAENYGQVYIRTDAIDELYRSFREKQVPVHPNGQLQIKPWGQKEFSLLDPDHNLLTFGETL